MCDGNMVLRETVAVVQMPGHPEDTDRGPASGYVPTATTLKTRKKKGERTGRPRSARADGQQDFLAERILELFELRAPTRTRRTALRATAGRLSSDTSTRPPSTFTTCICSVLTRKFRSLPQFGQVNVT